MKNDTKPTPVAQAPVATTQTSTEVAPQEPPEQNPLLSFLPLVLVFVVFYFFILKPQQKRQKAEKDLRESVKVGDRVVLNGIYETMPKYICGNCGTTTDKYGNTFAFILFGIAALIAWLVWGFIVGIIIFIIARSILT